MSIIKVKCPRCKGYGFVTMSGVDDCSWCLGTGFDTSEEALSNSVTQHHTDHKKTVALKNAVDVIEAQFRRNRNE